MFSRRGSARRRGGGCAGAGSSPRGAARAGRGPRPARRRPRAGRTSLASRRYARWSLLGCRPEGSTININNSNFNSGNKIRYFYEKMKAGLRFLLCVISMTKLIN